MLPPSSAAGTVLNPEPNTLKELPSPTLSASPQPIFCFLTLWNCSPLCHRSREEPKSNSVPTGEGGELSALQVMGARW